MNKDIACLLDWLCANRLSLNAKKTEIILFRLNNNIITQFKLRINQSTIKESIETSIAKLVPGCAKFSLFLARFQSSFRSNMVKTQKGTS